MWRANTTSKFTVNTQMNRNVGLLRLFPGITADTVSLCGNVCLYLPHIYKSLHSARVHCHIYSVIRSGPSCSLLWMGSYWRRMAAVTPLTTVLTCWMRSVKRPREESSWSTAPSVSGARSQPHTPLAGYGCLHEKGLMWVYSRSV